MNTDTHYRRCIDCIHFCPEKVKTSDRDGNGRKHRNHLYGCNKRPSGYIPYWVGNINDLKIYDNMLACFETKIGGQTE